MSSEDQQEPNNPFFDIAKLFGDAQGPEPWVAAEQLATTIASDQGSEANVDPLARESVDSLTRVAELKVAASGHVDVPPNVIVRVVTKAEWSKESLIVYRPFFERFGEALADTEPEQGGIGDPMLQMISQAIKNLGPYMVATSAGNMIGHIAKGALGQYDLPVPRPNNTILVVGENVDRFANEIGVIEDEVRLWILIREIIIHSILSVNHVRDHIENLFIDFASAFSPNTALIGEQFDQFSEFDAEIEMDIFSSESDEDFEFSDLENFGSPDAVLSLMRSPAQDLLIPQLDALVAVVLGYVDYMMDEICNNLIVGHGEISEALVTRRADSGEANHFMERLLGLELTQDLIIRGRNFVNGVLERAGQEGLKRLWADELDLPTAAEVNAPGLWLERIGFDSPGMIQVPDDASELDDL